MWFVAAWSVPSRGSRIAWKTSQPTSCGASSDHSLRPSSLVMTKRPLRVPTRTATPIEALAYRGHSERNADPSGARVPGRAERRHCHDPSPGRLAALDGRLGRRRRRGGVVQHRRGSREGPVPARRSPRVPACHRFHESVPVGRGRRNRRAVPRRRDRADRLAGEEVPGPRQVLPRARRDKDHRPDPRRADRVARPRLMLTLCDVGPRDGLQNEAETFEPAVRADLVNRLATAGLPRVEAVSFVRDDRVPQMAGAEEVVVGIHRREGTEYSGLVLNEQGYERFASAGLDRLNVTLGATEEFNRHNGNVSLAEAIERVDRILAAADRPATVTISVAFGCPFEGRVDPGRVVELSERFAAYEVVLADTIGVAVPREVSELTARTKAAGFHGHNTRNTGYANALAALGAGARLLDASVGGLGGCPYAPRASGNIATEDLVYLLEREGIETGVDLEALVRISEWLEAALGRKLEGQFYRAGTWL